MKLPKLIFIPFLLFIHVLNAQNSNWQWVRAGGGQYTNGTQAPWESWMYDMAVDKWGNIYGVGNTYDYLQFSGTTDTFPFYGATDAVIVKYDKCGNFLWAIDNGCAQDDQNVSCAVDTDGNLYVEYFGLSVIMSILFICTQV